MGLGPSLAEDLPNADPEISGQTAFSCPVNQPGRPILRPPSRQAISWVVGPSLAGNRPTARQAPSMGLGQRLAENLPNADRPILRPPSRQAISWVVGPSLAGNRPTARRAPSPVVLRFLFLDNVRQQTILDNISYLLFLLRNVSYFRQRGKHFLF